jgi:hypothetical protein
LEYFVSGLVALYLYIARSNATIVALL